MFKNASIKYPNINIGTIILVSIIGMAGILLECGQEAKKYGNLPENSIVGEKIYDKAIKMRTSVRK